MGQLSGPKSLRRQASTSFLRCQALAVRALQYQRHEALRGFFGFQEMVKRSVAIPSNGLHICAARTWGVHPHATVSGERSDGRQNPVSRASDRGRHRSALFKSEVNQCQWPISRWVNDFIDADRASREKSKLFSRSLHSFPWSDGRPVSPVRRGACSAAPGVLLCQRPKGVAWPLSRALCIESLVTRR